MNKKTLIILTGLLFLYLVSAISYSDCEIYGNCQPVADRVSSVNYSTVYVNSSYYSDIWITSEGNQDDVSDILFDEVTWTFGDDWNYISGGAFTFNDSKLLGEVWFFYINLTVHGTTTGFLEYTQQYDDYDGISYNLTEEVPDGLEFYANTSANVSTEVNKICIRYKAIGDDFDVSLWDINLNDWEGYLTLTSNSDFAWVCADIRDSSDHLVNDKIMIKIINAYQASVQNELDIDAMYVSSGYTPRIGNEVDPLSFHIGNNADWDEKNITNVDWGYFNYLDVEHDMNLGDFRIDGDGTYPGLFLDTIDNYDNESGGFYGGGTASSARGSYIRVHGNEFTRLSGWNGSVVIVAGVPNSFGDYAGSITMWTKDTEKIRIRDEFVVYSNITAENYNLTIYHLYVLGNVSDGKSNTSASQIRDAYDHISSTGASHTYIDQPVTTTSSPTFEDLNVNDTEANMPTVRLTNDGNDFSTRLFNPTDKTSDVCLNAYYSGGNWYHDDTDNSATFLTMAISTSTSRFYMIGAPANSGSPMSYNIIAYFDDDGDIFFPDVYNNDIGAYGRDLEILSNGEIGYDSSSRRYKENIRNLSDASWIYELNPVIFDRKDGTSTDEIGLIAEEVEAINPNLVSYELETIGYEKDKFGFDKPIYNLTNRPETILYSHLTTPLLIEVQNLKQENQMLKDELCLRDNTYSWCGK